VLDQESVRVTPIVEDLTALNMPADTPGPLITALAEVLASGRQRIEIADLIRRV
jgi:hypothetical protein